jgi:hypothetical protein
MLVLNMLLHKEPDMQKTQKNQLYQYPMASYESITWTGHSHEQDLGLGFAFSLLKEGYVPSTPKAMQRQSFDSRLAVLEERECTGSCS